MSKNTNISIIQLIKSGEISINYEISRIRAGEDVNVYIRRYLEKSNHYQEIQGHIQKAQFAMDKTDDQKEKIHFGQKLENLQKVEQDFISNTLYLAETLSKIDPRTDKLKKAIALFEEAKIREADAILDEAELLDDQFNLIALVEYQRKKLKDLENDLNITN